MNAEPAPHLHVVGCLDCERKDRMLAAMQIDLDNQDTDLKVKRRRITQLENELHDKRRHDPLYDTALTIFEFWRAKCRPSARAFSEDRLKNVLARLKERDPTTGDVAYTPRYVCEAILGAQADAYVDPKRKRHDDLELICRTGRLLEDFHGRWERATMMQNPKEIA
jgi:hypothetical protein